MAGRFPAGGIEDARALLLMAALATQDTRGVEIELLIDDRRRHAGEKLVPHGAHDLAAPRAEQAIVGPVRGGVPQRNADGVIGVPDLLDDVAHAPAPCLCA